MTSRERVMNVLDGRIPDRVPIALHNFLMASRLAGFSLRECLQSGEMMAESQLVAWREFGHDALLVESGTTAMAKAFGCEVVFSDLAAPRIADPVLKALDMESVEALAIPDPEKASSLSEVLKAVRILRRELGDSVFIMGRADQAPLALAAALRDHENFLMDLAVCEPEVILALADKCRRATARYALALMDAGAHGTCIGEYGSDSISPSMYRRYVMPNLTAFMAEMSAAGFYAGVHQCGNSAQVLPEMAGSGAKFLELDVTTDMREAKKAAQGKVTVLGMVDPANVCHLGDPDLVREKTREALEVMAPGGGFIVGPGCALVPEVPSENIAALVEAAREFGVYNPDGTLA